MPVGRVTDQMRYLGQVPQYNRLLARQTEVQRQISSGKRYDRADQNPLATGLAQRFQADDARLEQNQRNIAEMEAFANVSHDAIKSITQTIQRAHELAIAGGDATKTAADRQNIAAEVDGLLQGLIDLGTESYRGRRLFSGTQTNTNSFTPVFTGTTITGVTYNGNGQAFSAEFTPQSNLEYNLLGSNEFGGGYGLLRDTAAGVDVFQTMITLRDNLISNPAGLGASVNGLIQAMTHVNRGAVKIGAIQNRLASAVTLHEDQREQLAATSSRLVDTDLAAAISELSLLQNAYQATLATGARVGQLSLLNYLG